MKDSSSEREDLDASLENRIKSFRDVLLIYGDSKSSEHQDWRDF